MAIFSYRAFGTVLSSELALPDLRETAETGVERGPKPLRFSIRAEEPGGPIQTMGRDVVHADITVVSARHDRGFSLIYSDTGRFDIVDGGTTIEWTMPPGPSEPLLEAVRADLIGRVCAMALHAQGIECLHASAVSFGGAGVAIVAPKGWGKSTLAAALCAEGALLVSDDTLPISLEGGVSILPGVPHVRLRHDSAAHVFEAAAPDSDGERKIVFNDFPDESGAVALEAIYLLSPVTADTATVTRERVPEIIATLALVEHSKLGALLTGDEAATVFSRLADVVRQVPVYHLMIPRDLKTLPEAARTLFAWHNASD